LPSQIAEIRSRMFSGMRYPAAPGGSGGGGTAPTGSGGQGGGAAPGALDGHAALQLRPLGTIAPAGVTAGRQLAVRPAVSPD